HRDKARPAPAERQSSSAADHRARTRSDAASATSDAHLLLEIKRPDQELPGSSVSTRARAGGAVSPRLRAGVLGSTDVRGRADRGNLAAGRALHAHRGTAGHSVSALARCAFGTARTRADRVSGG